MCLNFIGFKPPEQLNKEWIFNEIINDCSADFRL